MLTEEQNAYYSKFCEFVREHVEAFGAASSSLCGLFTVQSMVAMTLAKWGTDDQKSQWLEPMAKGDIIGSFAMTEPKVGSDIQAIEKTLMAKYFASRSAARAAADTVQIMGAAGCHEENPAARYYRNAKIMEIIEGTDQVLQKVLGKSFCKKYKKKEPEEK
jgi:alkylation response protein AidB-like acyl-CoA dehydrogenase